jgi:hypothetical protein
LDHFKLLSPVFCPCERQDALYAILICLFGPTALENRLLGVYLGPFCFGVDPSITPFDDIGPLDPIDFAAESQLAVFLRPSLSVSIRCLDHGREDTVPKHAKNGV